MFSSFSARAIIVGTSAVAVLAIAAVWYVMSSRRGADHTLVIATGPVTGAYHAFGLQLAEILEEAGIVGQVEVRPTEGSVANMRLISGQGGAADLAIVQGDTPAHGEARLVASLWEEHLHLLVATRLATEIRTVRDLAGRMVSLGEAGSGTRQTARRVLDHFSVQVGQDLAASPETVVELFQEDKLDAAFLLTAVPSASVESLSRTNAVRFLPLGDAQERGNAADALELVFPNLRSTTIPHSAYGRFPERPVLTVRVTAQLIASSELDSGVARRITQLLFENRPRFTGVHERVAVASRIRERYDTAATSLPYHPGSVAYYTRQQPPFVVEYAETISLVLTVLVGLYSGSVALREWSRRRRKNRIDTYYVEAIRHFVDVRTASLESLVERRNQLVALRHRAFSDLVKERLNADESFTILQDQIESELRTIEGLINAYAVEHGTG
jgi:TRAP transporter TAXI family solute receptor